MKQLIILAMLLFSVTTMSAKNVTVMVDKCPATEVFRSLMEQTGKNFVYSTDILADLEISLEARNQPLDKVLRKMFRNTDIEFRIKGDVVVLKRKHSKKPSAAFNSEQANMLSGKTPDEESRMLDEVVVISNMLRNDSLENGVGKLTVENIRRTPALFGEADVMKAFQLQPGIVEGTEGMAGMHVHGGNSDENMYMLDGVPLYNVHHYLGLFSMFNADAISHAELFKSAVPERYDGRLSSFMDVRTANGREDGHHGLARIGLTSGAFNIGGPIGGRTTYNVALRRSWYEILTIPYVAMNNMIEEGDMLDRKLGMGISFMDLNAKISHRFGNKTSGYLSVYFGNDIMYENEKSGSDSYYERKTYDDKLSYHWGNLMINAGAKHKINSKMIADFTVAHTRYYSILRKEDAEAESYWDETTSSVWTKAKTKNSINDLILRADFNWAPRSDCRVRFGAAYTLHSFLPSATHRESGIDNTFVEWNDSARSYIGSEINSYIGGDWCLSEKIRVNTGMNMSMFSITDKTYFGFSPRLSLSYRTDNNWMIRGSFDRTTQYIHQIPQFYIAMPFDRWVPVMDNLRPATAEKVSAGAYWVSTSGTWAASVESYWKWMHNLLEYRNNYYLLPPSEKWSNQLTSGSGTAKGVDLKLEKRTGRLTGHISYSLAWSDRTFAEKNGGRPFPARFDNRYTINILINWEINNKVQFNASWTGHSGNHITFMPQSWEMPWFTPHGGSVEVPLEAPINNYQLPFYHRLDIDFKVRNRRGYWNFGLYNAYCNMNAIAIVRGDKAELSVAPGSIIGYERPVFKKLTLIPLIPSISYTWQF